MHSTCSCKVVMSCSPGTMELPCPKPTAGAPPLVGEAARPWPVPRRQLTAIGCY